MIQTKQPEDYLQDRIAFEVHQEIDRATDIHGPFNSAHEGFAVLLEEVDELWEEIKHGTRNGAREEAIQVAAMAIRLVMDIYSAEPQE